MNNRFETPMGAQAIVSPKGATRQGAAALPDYSISPSRLPDHLLAFLKGFVMAFLVLHVFYRIPFLSVLGGVLGGIVFIFTSAQKALEDRIKRLRVQFYDMLESLSVAMRAGNNDLKALQSARQDLLLIYPPDSDIVAEVDNIIRRFENNVPLSVSFADFADRCGLEDVASFASVFETIEGKSSRTDEIVQQTQQIIGDKMEIEMEIETLMTAAKTEVNIMLVMPIVILAIIGYMGTGFMDAIYTTAVGRIVATFGVIMFIVCYIIAQKYSSVEI